MCVLDNVFIQPSQLLTWFMIRERKGHTTRAALYRVSFAQLAFFRVERAVASIESGFTYRLMGSITRLWGKHGGFEPTTSFIKIIQRWLFDYSEYGSQKLTFFMIIVSPCTLAWTQSCFRNAVEAKEERAVHSLNFLPAKYLTTIHPFLCLLRYLPFKYFSTQSLS